MAADLEHVLTRIRACRICIESPRGPPLPHEPRPVVRASATARLAVCGQAPGTRVHATGIPFNDPSGRRLKSWMGVSDAEFYDETRVAIVPMGFCFPGLDARGADLPPRPECARAWRAMLFDQLPQIELILLVGQHAQSWHLGKRAAPTLTETVSSWRHHLQAAPGPRFLPLPHPSWRNSRWLKTNPWFERELVPVLQREVRAILG